MDTTTRSLADMTHAVGRLLRRAADKLDPPDVSATRARDGRIILAVHGVPLAKITPSDISTTREIDYHHTEWAVASDNGTIYEVEGKAEAAARREAAILRAPDEDGHEEPTAHVVERRICAWSGTRHHTPTAVGA